MLLFLHLLLVLCAHVSTGFARYYPGPMRVRALEVEIGATGTDDDVKVK